MSPAPGGEALRDVGRRTAWERWIVVLVALGVAYPVLWRLYSPNPLPFGAEAALARLADLRIGVPCLLEMLLLVVVAFLPRFRRQFTLGCATGMALATGCALLFYVGGGGMFFIAASLALATLARKPSPHGS